jgi:hypothetical protein
VPQRDRGAAPHERRGVPDREAVDPHVASADQLLGLVELRMPPRQLVEQPPLPTVRRRAA